MQHADIRGFPSYLCGDGPDEFEWTQNAPTMTRGARLAKIRAARRLRELRAERAVEKKRKKNTGADFRLRHARRVLVDAVRAACLG